MNPTNHAQTTPTRSQRLARTLRSGANRLGSTGVSASAVLLLMGAALSLSVAYQAYSSIRTHRAVVTGIMDDYALTAATYFEREARTGLSDLIEHLFHRPLHEVRPRYVRSGAPPLSPILHDPATDDEVCEFGDVGRLETAFMFSVSEREEAQVGPDVAGIPTNRIRDQVLAHMRGAPRIRRTEGVTLLNGPEPRYLAYSVQLVQRDTLLFVLPLTPSDLVPLFSGVVERATLLPATLTGGLPSDSLLIMSVVGPDGGALFSTGLDPERAGHAEVAFDPEVGGGVEARVEMRPRAADLLILGGAPRSRLPFLFGIILLSLTLIGVGVGQLRREQELARARSRFVANVSHELRTPIALQRIFIDMLITGRVPEEKDRNWSLAALDRETRRLGQLVENVLQFSRLERGTFDFRREVVDLGQELQAIVERFEPLLDPESRTRLLAHPDVRVNVDREALGHAVMNLLENARRYGPSGQTIAVHMFSDEMNAVILVDDEGPGIPPASRRQLWTAFQRGDEAEVAAKGGSGIGLAIVREIVEQHDGRATIEDAPGRGTRIRLQIPLADGPGRGSAKARRDGTGGGDAQPGRSTLRASGLVGGVVSGG